MERTDPPYVDGLGDDAAVNQAFFGYLDATADSRGMHDLAKAREIMALYRRFAPAVQLDLVEATFSLSSRPETGGSLLGYDICVGGFGISVIASCLLGWQPGSSASPYPPNPTTPLDRLWHEHFRMALNEYLLFPDYGTAEFCLACLRTLQTFTANLCESNEAIADMVVVGLWLVPDQA
jgi:hypothetical protein